ncbi:ABC transporter permease [Salinisphaera orenii YIM 95161]|uniref:ABC transporter permease n=1 Tax=Salinisphaera orenii YIM 95161 TaxID=1051139 RepID=A0A423PZU2_9GAMM|nr:ABC transporter permease [Salinisphaera halophila YIM 95161]
MTGLPLVSVPRNRPRLWLALLSAGLAAACVASLLFGAGSTGPGASLRGLLAWIAGLDAGPDDARARFVVESLRAPRTLIGVLVGAALGAAGALLQAVTRNPLAEPGLLGVSAGSALAVAIAIALGASAATLRVPVAQLGALAGCVAVLAASRVRGVGDDPIRLVLAGAVLSGLLGSLTSMILLFDERTADEIRFWVVGSLAGRRPADIMALLPGLGVALAIVVVIARPLAALALGERVATGLGHRPRTVRLLVIVAVALLVGSATAIAGPIAFVGLVAPFAARLLAGPDIRRTLWLSLPIGALLTVGADIASRLLVRPSELPLGVLTALVGAPVLVAVVRLRRLPGL